MQSSPTIDRQKPCAAETHSQLDSKRVAENQKPTNRPSRITKLILILVGHVSIVLGVVGIVLPLLPTTPFLLLAAACYMRGSVTWYNWLINQRHLGPYIVDYREGRGISLRLKLGLIAFVWITISISAILLIDILLLKIALFSIAAIVSVLIGRLPRRK